MKLYSIIVSLVSLVISLAVSPIALALDAAEPSLQPEVSTHVETPPSQPVIAPPVPQPVAPMAAPVVAQKAVPYGTVGANYGDSPLYISAMQFDADGALVYADLTNASDAPIVTSHAQLSLRSAVYQGGSCTLTVSNAYLLPNVSLRMMPHMSSADYYATCAKVASLSVPTESVVLEFGLAGTVRQQVTLLRAGLGAKLLWKSRPNDGSAITSESSAVLSDVNLTDFRGMLGELYRPYDVLPLRIVEVYVQPKLCAKNNPDLRCDSFVKVINEGNTPIILDQLKLRSGDRNTASSYARRTTLTGSIAPHSYAIISVQSHVDGELSLAREDGAVWFEDAFVSTISYATDVVYRDAELAANKERSWAYDETDRTWKWGIPSPYSLQNEFPTPGMGAVRQPAKDTRVPCREDQFRNPATGRCKSMNSTVSTLKPCRADQYRSQETGRCRAIASDVLSSLKPCKDGQFRNPATGRCKKIASLDDLDGLKPCPAGKERNPATNRCRNIKTTAMPLTDYAVEPTRQPATMFSGWLAIAGITAAAVGYGVWEWRAELAQFARRIRHALPLRK